MPIPAKLTTKALREADDTVRRLLVRLRSSTPTSLREAAAAERLSYWQAHGLLRRAGVSIRDIQPTRRTVARGITRPYMLCANCGEPLRWHRYGGRTKLKEAKWFCKDRPECQTARRKLWAERRRQQQEEEHYYVSSQTGSVYRRLQKFASGAVDAAPASGRTPDVGGAELPRDDGGPGVVGGE